jgi:hypothetical protein
LLLSLTFSEMRQCAIKLLHYTMKHLRIFIVIILAMHVVSVHCENIRKLYHLQLRVECTLCVIYKAGREPTPYW